MGGAEDGLPVFYDVSYSCSSTGAKRARERGLARRVQVAALQLCRLTFAAAVEYIVLVCELIQKLRELIPLLVDLEEGHVLSLFVDEALLGGSVALWHRRRARVAHPARAVGW